MTRIVLAVAAALVGLAVLIIIAPALLVLAVVVLIVAWRRPATVARVSSSDRLAPVPKSVRSTPMRFAASLVAVTLALNATSAAIAGPGQDGGRSAGDTWSEPPSTAAPTEPATATPEPTDAPTPTPTPSPSPTPTPTPTPKPTPVFGEQPTGPVERGLVVNIVDGDTIDVLVGGVELRVRLIGIDTPEVHSGVEWLGPEAAAAIARLVGGRKVVLEKDVSETDRYGRALRYVWIRDGSDWTLVNAELLRRGFATITTFPPDVKYVDALYVAAQDAAQDAGRGLWGTPPTPVPTPKPTPPPTPVPAAPAPVAPAPSNCHPSYVGYCLEMTGDWDCAWGEGNGPNYLPVTVEVVGSDDYDLDRDRDGLGCER